MAVKPGSYFARARAQNQNHLEFLIVLDMRAQAKYEPGLMVMIAFIYIKVK